MVNNEVSLKLQEQKLKDNRNLIIKCLDSDEVIDELIQVNSIAQQVN